MAETKGNTVKATPKSTTRIIKKCQFSSQALEKLYWIKLATNFQDFPAATEIFKDFQGLNSKAGANPLKNRLKGLGNL